MSANAADGLASCFYVGRVRHRRFAPRPHAFSYALTYLYLDLDERDEVFARSRLMSLERPNLVSWRRRDYLGDPRQGLREAVLDRVEAGVGRRPAGPVRMLALPAVLGRCFNPVAVYYCFEVGGQDVAAVVAEITNTPWGERHAYVLAAEGAPTVRARFPKAFHVSPFVDLDVDYVWAFGRPGERLGIQMEDVQRGGAKDYVADGETLFDATFSAERRALDPGAVRAFLARQPLAAAQVLGAIYFQAARLWLRRAPFYIHPDKRANTSAPTEGDPGAPLDRS